MSIQPVSIVGALKEYFGFEKFKDFCLTLNSIFEVSKAKDNLTFTLKLKDNVKI